MLSVRALSKTYDNGVEALGGIDLDIAPGEIVAVIGGSGCGKSTLLRLVSGLDEPTTGSIAIDGQAVRGPHPLINLIFQEPRLLLWLTVEDNVGFGLRGLGRDARSRQIATLLGQVGLQGYERRLPKQLSGGQAQRVAIARALVIEPKVLLLDEPFSALDAMTRAGLQDHLLTLWQEMRQTIVIVTHDIDEAVTLAHRAVVMRPWPGRISAEIAIDLPFPRRSFAQDAEPYRRRIHEELANSLADRALPVAAEAHA